LIAFSFAVFIPKGHLLAVITENIVFTDNPAIEPVTIGAVLTARTIWLSQNGLYEFTEEDESQLDIGKDDLPF
jgi:hypothetical protein